MTHDEETEEIRALLRRVHGDDERSAPFPGFLPESSSSHGRRSLRRILALAFALLVTGSAVALLWLRERPPAQVSLAWKDGQGPLDFLLQLPGPPTLDALPSLNPYAPVPLEGRNQ